MDGVELDTLFALNLLNFPMKEQTENHGVGGSIPPLGTIDFNSLVTIANLGNLLCPRCVRTNAAGERLAG
jgi:hypothetical protein